MSPQAVATESAFAVTDDVEGQSMATNVLEVADTFDGVDLDLLVLGPEPTDGPVDERLVATTVDASWTSACDPFPGSKCCWGWTTGSGPCAC